MKIKFNWGTGIVISCIIFMTFTVITGITLMNQKVDLVSDNYYEKEIKYQDQIDRINRTQLVSNKIEIEESEKTINISLKDASGYSNIEGEISFYRPSDSAKDFKLPLNFNDEGIQLVNTGKIYKGYWRVQVNWSQNGQEYYFEKPLTIN